MRNRNHDPFDTPFFRGEAPSKRKVVAGAAGFGFLALVTIVLNVLLWGGLIYFAFWCAKHFGVIG